MQSTGSSSSSHYHQNVKFANYEDSDDNNFMTVHLTHRKCELNSSRRCNSESDTSTNVHLRNKSERNSRCTVTNRCRRKVQCSSTWLTLFMVLTCLVIKLELVHGALNHNSNLNSVNYNHDNYTTVLEDASDILPFLDDVDDLPNVTSSSSRPQIIYQNEFAVHILGGIEKADAIAVKHGFTNMGQVRVDFMTTSKFSIQGVETFNFY